MPNERVTSVGKFNEGDEVVYTDGTVIPRGVFVVTKCTATCVWFEHCYSQPFNPDEFCLEDDEGDGEWYSEF